MSDRLPRNDRERHCRGNQLAYYAAIDSLPEAPPNTPYGTNYASLTEMGVTTINRVLRQLKLTREEVSATRVEASRSQLKELLSDTAELWMEFTYPELNSIKVTPFPMPTVRLDLGDLGGSYKVCFGHTRPSFETGQIDEDQRNKAREGFAKVLEPFQQRGKDRLFLALFASVTHQILIGNAVRDYKNRYA